MKAITLGLGDRVGLGLLAGAFLICRMEWGQGNSAFVFELFREFFRSPQHTIETLVHPVIMAGVLGLALLIYGAVARRPRRALVLAGILLPGLVAALLLLVGSLSGRITIIFLSLPYLVGAAILSRRVWQSPAANDPS
jgi:hypothetical protein